MTRDAESTRRRIYSVALTLFRERGYAKTTMRQIAKEAGLSLGAAYHHFDSKQAIVGAYYAQQTEAHEAAARAAMKEAKDLRERLGFVMHTALDVRGVGLGGDGAIAPDGRQREEEEAEAAAGLRLHGAQEGGDQAPQVAVAARRRQGGGGRARRAERRQARPRLGAPSESRAHNPLIHAYQEISQVRTAVLGGV